MIAFLKAIEAVLHPVGYPTHRIYASAVTGQYLVLGGKGWDSTDEPPLAGPATDVDTDVRVTAVTGTVDGVATMLDRVREVLSPGSQWSRVPIVGWRLEVRYRRSEFIDVDTSTTITGTNRHPAYGVDTYQLVAQPT